MKKWRKRILWTAIALAAVLAFPVGKHIRMRIKTASFRSGLIARGETFDLEALRSSQAADRAGVSNLFYAIDRFEQLPMDFVPGTMRFIAPGRARVTWKTPQLASESSEDLWPILERNLEELNRIAIAQIAEAVRSDLTFEHDYRSDAPRDLPAIPAHLVIVRLAGQALCAAATLDLHQNELDSAARHLTNALALIHTIRRDPIVNADLTRGAMITMTANVTWEALQHPGWSDAQLAAIQNEWNRIDLLGSIDSTITVERIFNISRINARRESFASAGVHAAKPGWSEFRDHLKYFLNSPRSGGRVLIDRYPKYWGWKWWDSYDEEIRIMEYWQGILETVRAVQSGTPFNQLLRIDGAPGSGDFARQRNRMGWNQNRIQRYFRRIAAADSARNLAITAIAIERYRKKHGHVPANLDDLSPEFLAGPPADLIDKQPLRYQRRDDGTFRLYSIGADGDDDGGIAEIVEAGEGRAFVRDVPSFVAGRDWVWPDAASEREVEALHQEFAAERPPPRARRQRPPRQSTETTALSQWLRSFVIQFGLRPIERTNNVPSN